MRQQAAAFLGNPVSLPAIAILGTRISPSSSSVGETLQVEVTLRNTGSESVATAGPDPGFAYGPADSFLTVGGPAPVGSVRVAVEVEGSSGPDHRYRTGRFQSDR